MNQKKAIIVQARIGSSRLNAKVLLEIEGKSLLQIGFSRLKESKKTDEIIYIIPDNSENYILKSHIESYGGIVFLGSETDVMDRYLKCAQEFNIDTIVRVTSDCPLVDSNEIDKMLTLYQESNLKNLYLSNYTPPEFSTYCNGSDIEIFSKNMLYQASKKFLSLKDKEHVTFQFWDGRFQCNHLKVHWNGSFDLKNIRLTVDYPEDIKVMRLLNNNLDLSKASLNEICYKYKELKLGKINGHFDSRAGWK